MPLSHLEGKAKLGQNRSHEDVLGLIEGLLATGQDGDRALAEITQLWIDKL